MIDAARKALDPATQFQLAQIEEQQFIGLVDLHGQFVQGAVAGGEGGENQRIGLGSGAMSGGEVTQDFAGIFHEGGTASFSSWLAYYPDHDLMVAVLSNTLGPNSIGIRDLVIDLTEAATRE